MPWSIHLETLLEATASHNSASIPVQNGVWFACGLWSLFNVQPCGTRMKGACRVLMRVTHLPTLGLHSYHIKVI